MPAGFGAAGAEPPNPPNPPPVTGACACCPNAPNPLLPPPCCCCCCANAPNTLPLAGCCAACCPNVPKPPPAPAAGAALPKTEPGVPLPRAAGWPKPEPKADGWPNPGVAGAPNPGVAGVPNPAGAYVRVHISTHCLVGGSQGSRPAPASIYKACSQQQPRELRVWSEASAGNSEQWDEVACSRVSPSPNSKTHEGIDSQQCQNAQPRWQAVKAQLSVPARKAGQARGLRGSPAAAGWPKPPPKGEAGEEGCPNTLPPPKAGCAEEGDACNGAELELLRGVNHPKQLGKAAHPCRGPGARVA